MVNTNLLKSKIKLNGMTQEEVSKAIGINPSTFSQKLNNEPGYVFSITEASAIGETLSIKSSEMPKIFFA
jgi:transcriptional regulator with XRE-family HTH domain